MRPSVRRALERLTARAEAAPVPCREMFRRAAEHQAGRLPAADYNREHTVELSGTLRLTYTLEEHRPGVMCRHLSARAAHATGCPTWRA